MSDQTHPPLTADGVRKLIARLDVDDKAVQNSRATSLVKQRAAVLVAELKLHLRGAILNEDDVNEWVRDMKPLFQELLDLLVTALGAGVVRGACFYDGGCIPSTAEECLTLGGSFVAGGACT